jgi:hypothetical protein
MSDLRLQLEHTFVSIVFVFCPPAYLSYLRKELNSMHEALRQAPLHGVFVDVAIKPRNAYR